MIAMWQTVLDQRKHRAEFQEIYSGEVKSETGIIWIYKQMHLSLLSRNTFKQIK